MAQWIELWSVNQRIAGSIPGRAQAWTAGQVPSEGGHARDNHTLMFFSLPLSLSLPLCLKINKILKEKQQQQQKK